MTELHQGWWQVGTIEPGEPVVTLALPERKLSVRLINVDDGFVAAINHPDTANWSTKELFHWATELTIAFCGILRVEARTAEQIKMADKQLAHLHWRRIPSDRMREIENHRLDVAAQAREILASWSPEDRDDYRGSNGDTLHEANVQLVEDMRSCDLAQEFEAAECARCHGPRSNGIYVSVLIQEAMEAFKTVNGGDATKVELKDLNIPDVCGDCQPQQRS